LARVSGVLRKRAVFRGREEARGDPALGGRTARKRFGRMDLGSLVMGLYFSLCLQTAVLTVIRKPLVCL
jgi:hypothetical protein